MKQMFYNLKAAYSRDRLWVITCIFMLATVASTFLGSVFLNITIPLVGELFPFRVLLPITFILYLIWAFKGNDHPWRDSSAIAKWTYVLIGILIVYGAVSLLRAVNFLFSFRRLFNLCFNMAFLFLVLRLCRNKRMLQAVIVTAMAGFVFFCGVGIYEVFNRGLFDDLYDQVYVGFWFMDYLHPPLATAGNTNDYCSILVFLTAVFLVARAFELFGKNNRVVQYAPVVIFPVLLFLLTVASARLNIIALWILLVVTVVHDLLVKRPKKFVVVLAVLLLGFVIFFNQCQPVIRSAYNSILNILEIPSQKPVETPDHQGNISLKDEIFEIDEDGNVILNETASGGVRARLLVHAGQCFRESYGLGVGLGNTEVLAAKRGIIPKWAHNESNSIHCFLARIVADYGIFVLIPLCIIAFLLLRNIWSVFIGTFKSKKRTAIAQLLFLLGCIAIYPIVSTASSDSQDVLAMWLYLAFFVIFLAPGGYVLPQKETPTIIKSETDTESV